VKHKQAWGFDQTVLSRFIWPLAINDSVYKNTYFAPVGYKM